MTSKNTDPFLYVALCLEVLAIILFGILVEYAPDDVAPGPETGATNTLSTYYGLYQDVHVMIFIGFGFLMTFMKKYSFTSVGLNFLLAAISIQYGMLINSMVHHCFGEDDNGNRRDARNLFDTVYLDVTTLIAGDFAAAAVLISFGAVLGKASIKQLTLMVFLELVFYSISEAINFEEVFMADVGGSVNVHMFGAYFGLAVAFMLARSGRRTSGGARVREKRMEEAESQDLFGSSYVSDIFAMFGTIFLWMYWPSFNGALASGTAQHRVVVNTVLSLSGSCISSFIFSRMLRPSGKLNMVDIQNATLAGGVAMGTSADFVIQPFAALLIGGVAGALSVFGYVKIQPVLKVKLRLHDTCGVHNLHGMPGLLGGLCGAIACFVASTGPGKWTEAEQHKLFSKVASGDRTMVEQGVFQIVAMLVTLCFSIVSGLITGKLMNMAFTNDFEYANDMVNWDIEDMGHWESSVEHTPVVEASPCKVVVDACPEAASPCEAL